MGTIGGSGGTPPVDTRIAALAGRQHGVVGHRQLLALGLHNDAIGYRVAVGRLQRLYRGVYAVGHRTLSLNAQFLAATLAIGPGAVLSHRSAAELRRLLAATSSVIHVSSPRNRASRGRLRHHRTRTLVAADSTVVARIPVTSTSRTLLDVADVAPPRLVERALDQAVILQSFDLRELEAALARANGRRGVAVVRGALERHREGPVPTRSELEEAFIAIVDAAGVRRPRTNVNLHGHEVDAYFPDAGVVVELDSFKYHRTRRSFERDRRRDIDLQAAGLRTLRFTDHRIGREPDAVRGDLLRAVDSATSRSS